MTTETDPLVIETLRRVYIDTCPFEHHFDEQALRDWAQVLPEPFQAKLWEISDRPDEVRCTTCPNPVGWVLDDDGPGRLFWQSDMFLVQFDDGPVVATCFDCSGPEAPESAGVGARAAGEE